MRPAKRTRHDTFISEFLLRMGSWGNEHHHTATANSTQDNTINLLALCAVIVPHQISLFINLFFLLDIYEGHSRFVSSLESFVSLNFIIFYYIIITSIFDISSVLAPPAMTFDWNTEYFVVAPNWFRSNPINAFDFLFNAGRDGSSGTGISHRTQTPAALPAHKYSERDPMLCGVGTRSSNKRKTFVSENHSMIACCAHRNWVLCFDCSVAENDPLPWIQILKVSFRHIFASQGDPKWTAAPNTWHVYEARAVLFS